VALREQEVESSDAGFCKALARGGLHVFGLPDYYARIRGGHHFYSIRISDHPLYSHAEPVHLLLALTEETIPRHWDKTAAWKLAYQWGERIPIGIFYRVEGVPTYEEQVPALKAGTLVKQPLEKL